LVQEERGMLGIEDPMVWSGYVLAIGLAVVCVIYGIFKWNQGRE
jgi:hypothetical protein